MAESSSSSSSSDEEEDDDDVLQVECTVDIPEEIDEVPHEERASVVLKCLLYTCTKDEIPVILKLHEKWSSLDYDEKGFEVKVSKAGSIMCSEYQFRTYHNMSIQKILSTLIDAGYIKYSHKVAESSATNTMFDRKTRFDVFKVISLDDAVKIAKEQFNSALDLRKKKHSMYMARTYKRQNVYTVALIADRSDQEKRRSLSRKIKRIEKTPDFKKIEVELLDDPERDNINKYYYDAVIRCGDGTKTRLLFDARKKRAAESFWGKYETHLDDNDEDLLVDTIKNEAKIKRRKKK